MSNEKPITAGSTGQATAALNEIVEVDLTPPSITTHQALDSLPAVSEHRRRASLKEHAFQVDELVDEVNWSPDASPQGETVLYLAYGSNLCAETFRRKRGIKPLAEVNVLVPELRLTFDLPGLPYVEPCFANVELKDAASKSTVNPGRDLEREPLIQSEKAPRYHKDRWKKGLVGVVYEVTRKDYAHIIATEGGGVSYKDILVTCYSLPDAATVPETPNTPAFKAHTLCAPFSPPPELNGTVRTAARRQRPVRSYAQPSARYLKLITDGADEHHLPSEYKAYLHELRPYTITRRTQRLGRFIYLSLFGPVLLSVFTGQKLFADKHGKSPRWYAAFVEAVFIVLWGAYDHVFKNLFGDGERTVDEDDDEDGVDGMDGKLSQTIPGMARGTSGVIRIKDSVCQFPFN
ncbi:MAG: hypothetical protein M1816_007354 [Peltula sp. TS41687]|nr:MAG: hypothetical protein M1816_007354 [Peltula sp. TS41687]